MSRYPFMEYVNDYMNRMKGVYAQVTWDTVMRRYNRINKDVMRLHKDGKLTTTSPKSMIVDDLRAYLTYRRSFNFSGKEYSHDESALRNLFRYVKNIAFEDCLMQYPLLKAHKKQVRLPSMSDKTYNAILDRALDLKPNDFRRYRAYALVLLCIKGSTRTKEIRLAKVSDLNLETWELHIAHPKGEHIYGDPRDVAIHPEVRPIVERYLFLRENWLIACSIESDALFPSNSSKDGHLTENSLRRIKGIVETEIGEKFDFRKCRRTFGQQLVDDDVDITTVSVLMGHKTTKTTENNYARMRNQQANDKLRGSW